MDIKAQTFIDELNMKPHPEGGYYAETYRAVEYVAADSLPDRFSGDRSFSTAIYFLLTGDDKSCFHRICADEIWHFYCGSPLIIHEINAAGDYRQILLGTDMQNNERPQAVVPHGSWFGAEVAVPDSFALVGCTVAPGFEFDDFEMADRQKLLAEYPEYGDVINRLTR